MGDGSYHLKWREILSINSNWVACKQTHVHVFQISIEHIDLVL